MLIAALLGALLLTGTWAAAAQGRLPAPTTSPTDLDPSFNHTGSALAPWPAPNGGEGADAASIADQLDGKVVEGGATQDGGLAVARFGTDGTLDASFATGGEATHFFNYPNNQTIRSGQAFLQTDYATVEPGPVPANDSACTTPCGRIVTAGWALGGYFAVARLRSSNGALDTTFNPSSAGGEAPGTEMVSLPGFPDSTFGGPSLALTGVAVQPDGKIVLAGWGAPNFSSAPMFIVARLDETGALDTTFGTGINGADASAASGSRPGFTATTIGSNDGAVALALRSDGDIVLGGASSGGAVVATYTTDGALDPTFNPHGSLPGTISSYGFGLSGVTAMSTDGNSVLAAGYAGSSTSDMAVADLQADGSPASVWNGGNAVTIPSPDSTGDIVDGIGIEPGGDVVVGFTDRSDEGVAILDTSGRPTGSRTIPLASSSNPVPRSGVAIAPTGQIDLAASQQNGKSTLNGGGPEDEFLATQLIGESSGSSGGLQLSVAFDGASSPDIDGTGADPHGGDVAVTISGSGGSTSGTAAPDATGNFSFKIPTGVLPAGHYQASATQGSLSGTVPVTIGQPLKLSVSGDGTLTPTIAGGGANPSGDNVVLEIDKQDGSTAQQVGLKPDSSGNFSFTIPTNTGLTSGKYAVQASQDSSYSPTVTFTLGSTGVPVVNTYPVSETSTTDMTVNGDVNPEGLPTTYYFQYGPSLDDMPYDDPAAPGKDLGFTDQTSHKVTVTLSPLKPGTQYCYRLVARNSKGITYGDDSQGGRGLCHSTVGGASAPQVTTARPAKSDIFSDHINESGTINPEGGLTQWYVQYGTAANLTGARQIPTSGTMSFPYSDHAPHPANTTIPNLVAGTTYYYRVVATNQSGSTTYGNIVSAQTLPPACQQQLSFGPLQVTATCLTRKGLTWATSGTVHLGGIVLQPQGGATIVIDPLNLRVQAKGKVAVVVDGHTIYTGSFEWVMQGEVNQDLTNQLEKLVNGFPAYQNGKIPGPVVNLPDLSSLPGIPKLPNGLPDFSQLDPTGLAKAAHTAIDIPSLNDAKVQFPTGLIPNITLPEFCVATDQVPFLANLPLTGNACLTFNGGVATIQANVALGSILQGTTVQLTLTVQPDGTVTVTKGSGTLPSLVLGPVSVQATTLTYDGSKDELDISGGAGWSLVGDNIRLEGGLQFTGGALTGGSIYLQSGKFGVPVWPGVTLNGLGVNYSENPSKLGATMGLGFGPGGTLEAKLNGTYTFGSNADLDLAAKLLLANAELADGDFNWNFGTGVVTADVKAGYTTPQVLGHAVRLDGELRGKFASGKFQVDGAINTLLDPGPHQVALANASTTVTSVGFAACGKWGPINAGVGFLFAGMKWNGWFGAGSCDLGPYQVWHTASDAAAGARSFQMPRHQREISLVFGGAGRAPQVLLHGPGGRAVVTPPGQAFSAGSGSVIYVDPADDRTTIVLANPPAGRWTATAAPGSAAITSIGAAHELPSPDIHARVVRGSAGQRVLVYRLHPLAGQQVSFREDSASVSNTLLSTDRRSGRVRFVPAYGPGGRRRIVATVTQDGLVRQQLVVARYFVPTRMGPPAPRGLRITRRGGRAIVKWHAITGTRRYLVTVVYNGGIHAQQIVTATKLALSGVFGNDPLSASVSGLTATDRPGGRSVARLKVKLPEPAGHGHRHKHRRHRRKHKR